jgi:hypothetical protein
MKKNQPTDLYYRNKYIIGLYTKDEYETCLTIVDNIHEFAELMEITVTNASMILSKAFRKKLDYIIFSHSRVKIEFIDKDLD